MRTSYNLYSGITKVKSKTKQFANKLTFGIAAGVASVGLAIIPMASAAGTTVVTPSNPQGWYIQPSTGGTVQYVSSDSGVGTGAVEFTTNTGSEYTRFKNDINMKLSSITSLSYMTHQVYAGDPQNAAVNLRLYIDRNNDGTFTSGTDDVLVYEPYYNASVSSTGWQQWNITQTSGYWWSNSNFTYNGNPTVGAGDANNIFLADVLHDFPNIKVLSIGLGTGTDNSPWTVQADALKVNSTTYNFELDGSQTPVSNKDQCKDNGWQNVTDSNGKTFKNQGDCVSFVATQGKNQPSGH